jgi:hypothetical protein
MNIYGSFRSGTGSTASRIVYSVTGLVEASGMFSSNVEGRSEIHVIEPQRPASRLACAIEPEVSCCCFSYGQVSLECYAEKDVYIPGESINVLCNVNNRSSKPLKRFELELVAVTQVSFPQHSTRYEISINKIYAPGCEQGSAVQGLILTLPVVYG